MLCSAAELQISDDHEGIIELPDDAPVGARYAEWAKLDDPVIEIGLTPNRPDCTGVHGVARDLAAADMGTFKDPAIKPVQGRVSLPGRGQARFRRDPLALPRLRAAARARGEERTVAGLAAAPAHRDRPAADQPARRYHQLHHLRPRPAAACVRRRQGARKPDGAPRPRRRNAARARRQDLRARRRDVRDRRRARGGIARRHHGRGGDRLLGDDHRRPDRVGAVGRHQYRAHRPQARRQFGRALPLRARRRSRLHAAGPRTRDPDGARSVRRRAVGHRRGGKSSRIGPRHRVSARRAEAAGRARCERDRDQSGARPPRLLGLGRAARA